MILTVYKPGSWISTNPGAKLPVLKYTAEGDGSVIAAIWAASVPIVL